MNPARTLPAAAFAAALCALPAARADEASGLHVTLGTTAQQDANLLRLPDGRTPRDAGLDDDRRGDTLLMPYVMIDGVFHWGRQGLLLHAGIRGLHYGTYSNFDTHVADWRTTWRGAIAGEIDGDVGAGREQQITRFEDFVGSQRNVLSVRSINARANWRPRPDRRVSLLLDDFSGANSQQARRGSDYRIRGERVEAGATTAHGNEVAIGARYTDGNYPNRGILAAAPVDNSYRQYQADLSLAYNPGGRTRLDLRGGYAWRRHEQVPERNFSARVGHAVAAWQATGKLVVEGELGRDVDAVDDFDRVFAVTTTRRVEVKFQLTAKVLLDASVRRRKISYRGDPENFLSQLFPVAPREDALRERSTAVVWAPSDRWFINTSYQWLDRTSNRADLQYRARVLQVTTQYQW